MIFNIIFLITFFLTLYIIDYYIIIPIINLIYRIYCFIYNISYDGINYKLVNTNIDNLQSLGNYYEYKNKYNAISSKDFIFMLDNLLIDIENHFYKENILTLYIIFFEYNPKSKLCNVISQPFIFEYDLDNYLIGEDLLNSIIFTTNINKINTNNNILIKINIKYY